MSNVTNAPKIKSGRGQTLFTALYTDHMMDEAHVVLTKKPTKGKQIVGFSNEM